MFSGAGGSGGDGRTDAVGEDDERVLGAAVGVSPAGEEVESGRREERDDLGLEGTDEEDEVVQRWGSHSRKGGRGAVGWMWEESSPAPLVGAVSPAHPNHAKITQFSVPKPRQRQYGLHLSSWCSTRLERKPSPRPRKHRQHVLPSSLEARPALPPCPAPCRGSCQ